MNNNHWDRGDRQGFAGERYVDGVCIERTKFDDYHRRYAGRNFGDLGHRRLLVIADNEGQAVEWSRVPGVTLTTCTTEGVRCRLTKLVMNRLAR